MGLLSPAMSFDIGISFHTYPCSDEKGQFEELNRPGRIVSEPTIMLTGIDEGISVKVSTTLEGPESPKLILESILKVFPDFKMEKELEEPIFGNPISDTWKSDGLSMNNFLKMIHQQAILDTALDVMSMNLTGQRTHFEILRQASIAGKIAFNINSSQPLGGTITIELTGNNIEHWLEAATWHNGRDTIPKRVNDDRSFDDNGEPTNWI